ncbi:MAG: hypothetical protein R3B70_39770 [Polyangiaceae bacterium]
MKKISPTSSGALLTFAAGLALAGLTACGSTKEDPTKDRPAAQPPANTQVAAGNNAPANTQMANNPAPANPPADIAPQKPAAAGPNGRSTVPTMDEWSAAKEIGVRGSTKLNCETKMVREWLRVSCRGKNDTGGEPKSVNLKKGGGKGDTFTFASNKVTSLVCPFVNGTDIVAEFEWTDKKQELVVSWPYGAPEPPMKGEFR